jgi:hypothetical protein
LSYFDPKLLYIIFFLKKEKIEVTGHFSQLERFQLCAAIISIFLGEQLSDILDQIEKSPYRERGTGFTSLGNIIPGTGGYDFENMVEQAKSGAFLQAIQQLRGMGALSNNEGQTATAALTRMDTATSEGAFLKALQDYRAEIEKGRSRAMARIQQGGQMAAPTLPQGNVGTSTDVQSLIDQYAD